MIGYMEDLTAATQQDVVEFFKKYYAPNNASLVDRRRHRLRPDAGAGREVVQRVPARRRGRAGRAAGGDADRGQAADADRSGVAAAAVSRLAHAALYAPGDAALDVVSSVLTGGKNSRLYKRLVYDTQMAQDVSAFQSRRARQLLPDRSPPPRPGTPSPRCRRRSTRSSSGCAASRRRARGPARAQPDRGVVLPPHGARRRLRRQGRSAERLLLRRRRRRTTSPRTWRATRR